MIKNDVQIGDNYLDNAGNEAIVVDVITDENGQVIAIESIGIATPIID